MTQNVIMKKNMILCGPASTILIGWSQDQPWIGSFESAQYAFLYCVSPHSIISFSENNRLVLEDMIFDWFLDTLRTIWKLICMAERSIYDPAAMRDKSADSRAPCVYRNDVLTLSKRI